MSAIYLDARDVPATLRGGYRGSKFRVQVTESVNIPSHAGLWDGGSRDVFSALRISDGTALAFPWQAEAPWSAYREHASGRTIDLKPGFAVVKHTTFCGNDMGLTFFLHPADAAPMLPAPAAELTDAEKHVLASRGFKSSYGGKDRYQMQRETVNPVWAPAAERKPFPTRDEWTAAENALKARGLLNKAGAITPAGRNARGSI